MTSVSTMASFKQKNSLYKTKTMNNFYSPLHSQHRRLDWAHENFQVSLIPSRLYPGYQVLVAIFCLIA